MLNKIIEKLAELKKSKGWLAVAELFLFPVTLLIWNPIRLARTLWNARILAKGKWSEYILFHPKNGINSMFYWTQALNIERYGRDGISPYLGTGNFHLGNWWHLSLTSTYLYKMAGAVLPLLSMLGWLGFNTLWLDDPGVDSGWGTLVLFLAVLSSYFYAAAFVFLNYNALGWLFFPLALWGMVTGNYWIAAFGWLIVSLGSLTAVVVGGVLALVWAIYVQNFMPLLAIIPAGIKLLSHLSYTRNIRGALLDIAKGIGLIRGEGVKYKRPRRRNVSLPAVVYTLLTYTAFCILLFENIPWFILVLTVTVLYFVNIAIARFADEQSLYVTMLSVATPAVMVNPDWLLLTSYWFLVSPLPFLIRDVDGSRIQVRQPPRKPFWIKPLIDRCQEFFKVVAPGGRVLLGLENPEQEYHRIFDGYRVIYELAFYTGNLQKIHVMPDWYAIFYNNYEGAPEFWGREPQEVIKNMHKWNADHVLIYQEADTSLDQKWNAAGFTSVGVFDWSVYLNELLDGEKCWSGVTPKWWLLKKYEDVNR